MPRSEADTAQSWTEGMSRYGDIECVLAPDIEANCPKEYDFTIEVPEEVLFVCREIRALGGKALLVGGSVRDTIINKVWDKHIKFKDFDIEVYGIDPEDLIRIVRNNYEVKEGRDLVGKSFQVLNIYAGLEYPINISIPREDSKVGEGHTKGFVTSSHPEYTIKEAAQRRDITINSAAYDPLTGILYDPYGAIDAVQRQSIEVTDKEKFVEDALRVLRIAQFAARFPDFTIPPETMEFCKKMVSEGMLDELSANRVRDEVEKMLTKGEKPSLGMKFLLQIGYIEKYWPEFYNLVDLYQDMEWHPEIYVWEHTLQAMDAAAKIADRENLDDRQRKRLLYAAMGHDLAKLETFDVITVYECDKLIRNRIVTRGHEEKGGPLTREFLKKLSPKDEPNAGISLEDREAIVALVESHLKPKYFWQEATEKNINMSRAIRKYARRLAMKNTNWYMLSLLAEADQRGRNGKSDIPMERDQVEDLVAWQLWLAEISSQQKVVLDAPAHICNSDMVKSLVPDRRPGPWIGVIIECVYQDEIDLLVTNPEEAAERAAYYFEKLNGKILEMVGDNEKKQRSLWDFLKKTEDPRVYFV
ncbi:MAG: TRNA nucleotidyltransferase [Candidatus Collierbacteria bacterium GW2011_GWC2_43_12]|uniref:tRNA nucleotidyltransferase n=1 Tax=Candidatus Collierbacteria bacterium GW2011_GWC2_43_12 TaxID=1618390 RepID=A0A0G1D407_9BACT|nr:MAG: TRNA nucleotidyltransferase [Candidatus Collierbacteria bacterium GW2011_GWC2_43_12]